MTPYKDFNDKSSLSPRKISVQSIDKKASPLKAEPKIESYSNLLKTNSDKKKARADSNPPMMNTGT